ncbi:uncharacterized protein LOC119614344 [Lucilia sericata]|uniref:uncharacterized protein LOC119614344 n=1 Tax=Lucilia sericata TaxID=13632 RepID=UPI0018A852A1|nr:uncharacterized protein LOC119614344 [Lucilia sericata]
MLSRLDIEEVTCNEDRLIDLDSDDFKDSAYLTLIQTVIDNSERLPDIQVKDNKVYKKVKFDRESGSETSWKVWLPNPAISKVLGKCHMDNTVHGGVAKTLHKLRELFYWPTMVKDTKNYVRFCDCVRK